MKIDNTLISKLEKLARLQLSETERERLITDLNAILEMVEKLEELDTDGVEPLTHISDEAPMGVEAGREDEIKNQVEREAALANAPDQDGRYFKVPKVIDLNQDQHGDNN